VERKERKRGNGQRFVRLSVSSASSSLFIDALPSFLDTVPGRLPSPLQPLKLPPILLLLLPFGPLGVDSNAPHEKETILI
jgi:hypothetical protein